MVLEDLVSEAEVATAREEGVMVREVSEEE